MRRPTILRTRLRRAAGGVICLLAVTLVSAPAQAAGPAFAGIEGWAWLVDRQPATASLTPGPLDQGSSVAGTNSVTRSGPGAYIVRLGGLQTPSPVIHVSALGGAPNICAAGDHGLDGADHVMEVACFDRHGVRADAAFVVNVVAYSTLQDDMGYVLATQPLTAQYHPDDQFNSAENQNTVFRRGKGRWAVVMPSLGGIAGRGSVVVTAAASSPTTCRVTGWSAGIEALVACRGRSGALQDRAFNLTYLRSRGLKGAGEGATAYLRADRPTAARSTPATGFWFSSAGKRPVITRVGVGSYRVTLPGMPLGGSAQVSAFGAGSGRCVVSSIRTTRLPQRIGVRCYRADGSAPADTRFTLSYAR